MGQHGPNPVQPGPKAGQPEPTPGQSGPIQSIENELTEEFLELAEEIQEHLAGKSPLDALTEENQKFIMQLLDNHDSREVAQILRQSEPIGFNLKTSKSSINRFRQRWLKREHLLARQNELAKLEQILAKNNGDHFKSSIELIEARLLKAAASDRTQPADLQLLIKTLTNVRRLALAERKQTHREQQ